MDCLKIVSNPTGITYRYSIVMTFFARIAVCISPDKQTFDHDEQTKCFFFLYQLPVPFVSKLTLNIQVNHSRRTVSNFVGRSTRVPPMLVSRSFFQFQEFVVWENSVWTIWKSPMNSWRRVPTGIAKQICCGRFVDSKVSSRMVNLWWIWNESRKRN